MKREWAKLRMLNSKMGLLDLMNMLSQFSSNGQLRESCLVSNLMFNI